MTAASRKLACIMAARRVQFPSPSSQTPSFTSESPASSVESTRKVTLGVGVGSGVEDAGETAVPEAVEGVAPSGAAVNDGVCAAGA